MKRFIIVICLSFSFLLCAKQESFISAGVFIKPNADLIQSLSKIGYPENIDPHRYHVSLIIFQLDVTDISFEQRKKLARSIKKFLTRITYQTLHEYPKFYQISLPFNKLEIFKEKRSQYLVATFVANQMLQDMRTEIKEKFMSRFPSATTRHDFIPHISLAKKSINDSLEVPGIMHISAFVPHNIWVSAYIKKKASRVLAHHHHETLKSVGTMPPYTEPHLSMFSKWIIGAGVIFLCALGFYFFLG